MNQWCSEFNLGAQSALFGSSSVSSLPNNTMSKPTWFPSQVPTVLEQPQQHNGGRKTTSNAHFHRPHHPNSPTIFTCRFAEC
jgi:hypothetical protein